MTDNAKRKIDTSTERVKHLIGIDAVPPYLVREILNERDRLAEEVRVHDEEDQKNDDYVSDLEHTIRRSETLASSAWAEAESYEEALCDVGYIFTSGLTPLLCYLENAQAAYQKVGEGKDYAAAELDGALTSALQTVHAMRDNLTRIDADLDERLAVIRAERNAAPGLENA